MKERFVGVVLFVTVDIHSPMTWITSLYLAIVNAKFFHEILNFMIFIIFHNVAMADPDNKV